MASVNLCVFLGNCTRDIELRHLPNGGTVAEWGIACNRKWKNQAGEAQEDVLFLDCAAFGKLADVASKYLAKGRPVFIQGHLRLEQWTDKEGGKRSKMKCIVDSLQLLGDGRGVGSSKPQARTDANGKPYDAPRAGEEEDLPF